jgi:ABC-type multidrug transport system ATPase subunit
MPTRSCPSCGRTNPSQALFCDACGAGLSGGRIITIGREPDNDVVLDYPMVSAHHARILQSDGGTFLEDLGSTNGTALDSPARKIRREPLAPSATVYFGSLPVPASRLLGGRLSLGSSVAKTVSFRGDTLVFGRDPTCDVVLDYPMVSWQHVRLSRRDGQVLAEDLGSTNGTFVNGLRISGQVPVAVGSTIGLGSYTFRLAGLDRIEQRDYRGNVTVEARGLAVEVPGRRLIDEVSLTIYPSELVGLMGPSGAGKTTLLSALNGYLRPTQGAVFFNGQDLYASYDRFRAHLGYVPQDDIMHSNLTVRQALTFTARLRLPTDTRPAEIAQRVDGVLEQLQLTDAADVLIGSAERKGISGGQRKRVNLAMELLTDPFVLFLDEPTSGLSSEDALMVMRLLRRLADGGKTILLTIHQPSRDVFRLMDSLVLVAKQPRTREPGRMVYFGPAYPEAVRYFEPAAAQDPEPSPDLMLRGLAGRPVTEWTARYAASPEKRQYVDQRAGTNPAEPAPASASKGSRGNGLAQWWTLVERNLAVKIRDRANMAILLAQAPLIAVLIGAVFRRQEPSAADPIAANMSAETSLFLMVVAAIWFGCSNSAREIVGEWAIYRRERMVNLRIPAYLGSKLAVLGGLCAVQCGALLAIVAPALDLAGPFGPMFGLLFLGALIGTALGLLVSAAAPSSETAIALVPLLLLPMVILGGMMQPVHLMPEPVRPLAHAMPSRWAYEGLLILESQERQQPDPPAPEVAALQPGAEGDAPPVATPKDLAERCFPNLQRSTLFRVIGVCGGVLTALIAAIALQLRFRDIHGPFSQRRLP